MICSMSAGRKYLKVETEWKKNRFTLMFCHFSIWVVVVVSILEKIGFGTIINPLPNKIFILKSIFFKLSIKIGIMM